MVVFHSYGTVYQRVLYHKMLDVSISNVVNSCQFNNPSHSPSMTGGHFASSQSCRGRANTATQMGTDKHLRKLSLDLGATPFCLSSISSYYCFFSENLSSFIYPHRTHTSDKMLIQVLFIDLIFSWTNPMSIFRHPPVQVGMQVLQYPCAPQSATGLHTFSNLSMEWFGRRVKEPQLFILFF